MKTELLLPYRFDLMAKYIYIKFKENEINIPFYKDLYKEHIITFNNCWEYPGTKNGIDDFYNSFDILIENIKKKGFDKNFPILIDNKNILVNGSHRLITSFYFNINPVFKICNEEGNINYNYNFFINRNINPKLNKFYSDYMALEYVKLNPLIRTMVIYPNVNLYNNFDKIINIINNYGYIYYHKNIQLNNNGINNLIKEMYRNEEWIGGLFPKGWSPGGKAERCHGIYNTVIILIELADLNKCIELKEKCRKIFNLGKHSLHISDEQIDTFRIASALLNNNSINFLNNGTNDISDNSKLLLNKYFNKVDYKNEDYCITSSILLEMYGLRYAKDIDYLNKNSININIENIGIHNGKWLSYYNNNIDELIYNPKNYFYFNGYKFLTLKNIYEMKKNRNENKDIKDIKLIEKIGLI